MKVQCGQCPAKYAVSDERVQDKKVRIHCKRCGASIVVDGKVDPPLVTSTPARKSVRPAAAPSDNPPPAPIEREPDSRPSPRPVAHTIMGGLEAPAAERLQRTRSSPPPRPVRSPASPFERDAPPGGRPEPRGLPDPHHVADENRWRVALTKQDLRWMTTSEIIEAFQGGAIKLETFVFRAGMPTWVTLLEVPEIAQALSDKGSGPEVPPPSSSSAPPPPRAQPSSPDSEEDSAFAALDDLDAVEPVPFALVAERANGASAEAAEGEQAPPAPFTRAAEAVPPRHEPAPAPAGPAAGDPRHPAIGHSLPGADAGHADMGHSASIPFPAAQQVSGGSTRWVWVAVVLLLLGAAAAFFGPRYGFKLL